jgi:hypothetical protein
MSLIRLVIWSSLVGGWSAFIGWLFLEVAVGRWVSQYDIIAIIMATVVAIPIGGGVSLAYGLTNPKLDILLKRLLFGLAGGLVGGLLGILFGSCIFSVFNRIADYVALFGIIGRVFGWALIGVGIGIGIGASEGIIDHSLNKLRNGLLGGAVGGLLAGLFFLPVSFVLRSDSGISSRAIAFVLLGLFIGFFIGLAQVILKEAWLTVEEGFRPGRQIILGGDLITMGTSEKSSLIFIAYGAKGVEPTHLKISKRDDRYLLEDNQSRSGTLLNGQPIIGPTPLNDGDAIQFGVNVVRFNERIKHGGRLPPSVDKESAKAIPADAIQVKAATLAPLPVSAVQAPAKPAPPAAPKSAPAKAPVPSMDIPAKAGPALAKPAAPVPAQPQEGHCPICDRKITGIPGERRCGKCFTTF